MRSKTRRNNRGKGEPRVELGALARSPRAIFRDYCSRNRLRFTRERGIIIDEIYRENAHFDVDRLFLSIRGSNPDSRLAKGTIYRTIPHLLRASLLRVSLSKNGRVCYEQALGQAHHDHMQCLKCGRILEFHDGATDKIQEAICRKHRFSMLSHTHVIRGHCAECSGKSAGKTADSPAASGRRTKGTKQRRGKQA